MPSTLTAAAILASTSLSSRDEKAKLNRLTQRTSPATVFIPGNESPRWAVSVLIGTAAAAAFVAIYLVRRRRAEVG